MNTLNNAVNKYAVTALYVRLSKDDMLEGESNSITNQVVICKGGILPPNTYYDCGSFVVNRKAVIRKEKKSIVTAANSTQNGAVANNRKLKPALLAI